MATVRDHRINLTFGILAAMVVGFLLIFKVLTATPHASTPDNRKISNTQPATTVQMVLNAQTPAMYRASCTLNDGQAYNGIVAVSGTQKPGDLKAVELKSSAGDMVRFAQADATCTYAPL